MDCFLVYISISCVLVKATANNTCAEDEFRCDSGQCIPKRRRCNVNNNCPDHSDERGCANNTCAEDEFRCDSGQCIPKTWRCDAERDCPDHSDERGCANNTCAEGRFRCDSGHCIFKSWRCDVYYDCPDRSDERGCGPPSAPKNFFFKHTEDKFLVFGLVKGFNGGYEQTFVIEHKPFGNHEKNWSTALRITERDLGNSSTNEAYYVNTPKLQDGRYLFKVHAENEKGKSSAIEDVYVEVKTEHQRSLMVPAITGTAIGAALLVIIIVIVALIVKRRSQLPKNREDDTNNGTQMRPLESSPLHHNTSFNADVSATGYESLQARSTNESLYQIIHNDQSEYFNPPIAHRPLESSPLHHNTSFNADVSVTGYESLQARSTTENPYEPIPTDQSEYFNPPIAHRFLESSPLHHNTSFNADVSATGYEKLQARSTTESPYEPIPTDQSEYFNPPIAFSSFYPNTSYNADVSATGYESLQAGSTTESLYQTLNNGEKKSM